MSLGDAVADGFERANGNPSFEPIKPAVKHGWKSEILPVDDDAKGLIVLFVFLCHKVSWISNIFS